MKKFACILLMAVPVSGCSIAGVFHNQIPVDSAGWSINWSINYQSDRKEPTAEFACNTYKYRLTGGINVSESMWFGPPLIPIIPPIFQGSPRSDKREFDLIMEGNHANTFPCPVITSNGQEYKALDIPEDDYKRCRYTIPTPKDGLTLSIADQMGCKVTPLDFKLTPERYYYPLVPPQVIFGP